MKRQLLQQWNKYLKIFLENLKLIEEIMKKEDHHTILQEQLIPSSENLFPRGNFVFQENNDPNILVIYVETT